VNFDLYCQEKAAPAGTPVYYAVRQAAVAQRPLLTALFAFRRELEDTVENCSEVAIGQAKLAWWQGEVATLAGTDPARVPVHPVTCALAAYLPVAAAKVAVLQAVVQGYEMDLEQARYLDFRGLSVYLDKTGGQFAQLVARAGGVHDAADLDAAGRLGQALVLAHIVREVGHHARQGRIYIPVDEMQRFGVTAAEVINRRYSEAFTALMTFQLERARAGLQQARSDLRHLPRRPRATLDAQAAIALAMLDEIEADAYQVLHQHISLTPIRMAWLAWRAAR